MRVLEGLNKEGLNLKITTGLLGGCAVDATGEPYPAETRAKAEAAEALRELRRLLHAFPALVVPLELRESSDVLMDEPKGRRTRAIDRMLTAVARVSAGGDPCGCLV